MKIVYTAVALLVLSAVGFLSGAFSKIKPIQPNEYPIHEVKQKLIAALKYRLKDPDSVQFEIINYHEGIPNDQGKSVQYFCGSFNAKNRFGAYVGYRGFALRQYEETFSVFYNDHDNEISIVVPEELTSKNVIEICDNKN